MKYNRICQILGIEKPVIQGPLSWLTDARLVAAVSNAGGLGVLGPNAGLTAETAVSTPEETAGKMREEIRKTKKLTEKPFGVNLIPTPENDIWTPPILQVINIDRQERLDGYREALEEYGISPDPRWVISVPFNEEGGERAAHQLINSGLPLTAAVTFNDVMAAGIMRILHQRGVQLPQQLSIVGFDDVVLARYLYPALTTMHYPVEQMARCAAQLAIQLYQGITPPPSSNHFNAELVIRDSVAPYFSR